MPDLQNYYYTSSLWLHRTHLLFIQYKDNSKDLWKAAVIKSLLLLRNGICCGNKEYKIRMLMETWRILLDQPSYYLHIGNIARSLKAGEFVSYNEAWWRFWHALRLIQCSISTLKSKTTSSEYIIFTTMNNHWYKQCFLQGIMYFMVILKEIVLLSHRLRNIIIKFLISLV